MRRWRAIARQIFIAVVPCAALHCASSKPLDTGIAQPVTEEDAARPGNAPTASVEAGALPPVQFGPDTEAGVSAPLPGPASVDSGSCTAPGPLFEVLPITPVAFWQTATACATLPSGFLLKNTSGDVLDVLDITVADDAFAVEFDAPVTAIDPGRFVAAHLSYTSQTAGSKEAVFTVRTRQGCEQHRVLGIATDDESVVNVSAAALDLGSVIVGETSQPATVQVMLQRATGDANRITLSGFSAYPPDQFRVVSAPTGLLEPQSCQPYLIQVVFDAPATPGAFDGSLTWYMETETADGTFEALIYIQLFGEARSAN